MSLDSSLSRANLIDADLFRANLSEAYGLTNQQLEHAIISEGTQLPNYLKESTGQLKVRAKEASEK